MALIVVVDEASFDGAWKVSDHEPLIAVPPLVVNFKVALRLLPVATVPLRVPIPKFEPSPNVALKSV